MRNETHIQTVVILSVTDSTITLNINGEYRYQNS